MKKKRNRNVKSRNSKIINFCLSIGAFLVSLGAVVFAYHANQLALQNNKLAHQVGLYEVNVSSYNLLSEIYDRIYDRGINDKVINKLRNNEEVEDPTNLKYVVNLLEDVGSHLCDGRVFQTHVRTQLGTTMNEICNNEQLLSDYGGKRNGVAYLCLRLDKEGFPSKFAQTFDDTNEDDCRPLDENLLLDLHYLNDNSYLE